MRPAAYLRVSTLEQERRESIETQRDALRQAAQRDGIAFVATYEDNGVSGGLGLAERPAGRRLLTDLQARRFDTLYIYRLDRLGRDPLDTLTTLEVLREAGVRIVSLSEQLDTLTAAGKLMTHISVGFAGYERDLISERVRAGMDRCARAGQWHGTPPYGYRVADRQLVPDDTPAAGSPLAPREVVPLIYRLAVEERLGSVLLAERLDSLGLPPARGRRWHFSSVVKILHNPAYKGETVYARTSRKGQPRGIPVEVPALVSADLWERAQRQVKANRNTAREGNRRYLLSGLLRCGREACGLAYQGFPSRQGRAYYLCAGKSHWQQLHRPERCGNDNLRAEHAEARVWETCLGALRSPEATLAELLRQRHGGDREARELAQVRSRLARVETERERVILLYRRGVISDEEADRGLQETEAERARLRAREAELAQARPEVDVPALATAWRSLAASLPASPEWDDQRLVVERLFVRIEAHPGRELRLRWRLSG